MKILDRRDIPKTDLSKVQPFDFNKDNTDRTFYSSLCFPSTIDGYSECIQAMQEWFLDRLAAPKGYFKSIYIDGRHVLNDYRSMSDVEKLKRIKPNLAITASVELDYDQDKVYAEMYGGNLYNRRGAKHLENAFFKDNLRHLYMDISMEVLLMHFEFKVRLSTRAQQIDMYKRIQVLHRVGFTETVNLSVDFHVPYSIISQVARDAGFKMDDKGNIVHITEFVSFLNSRSQVPFLLKYRTINGKYEFFIRIEGVPMHISSESLDRDDGEQQNQLDSNHIVTLSCTTRFPVPKFYVYYSETKHEDIEVSEINSEYIGLRTVKLAKIPETNKYGWNLYMSTEIAEDTPDKPSVIDFSELFTGDLREIMNATTNSCISCGTFMEIYLMTEDGELDYEIDWCNLIVKTVNPPEKNIIYVGVYVDLKYINEYIITHRQLLTNRLTITTDTPETPIGTTPALEAAKDPVDRNRRI